MRRHISTVTMLFIFLIGLFSGSRTFAEEGATSYSGSLWSRSTLAGDWGGARDDLAKKGVTIDLSLTQIVQGSVGGGKKTGWEYGGRGNLTLNIDTQKMGLWPGGFFTAEVEGNFNNDVNLNTGALMTVNSSQFYPMPESDQLNMPELMFTQFFSEYAGVFAGKMDTIIADANEFAHGKGDTQFFNLAFNLTPVAALATPTSTLGGGIVVLPTKDPNAAVITLMAISSDGKANNSGFDKLFKGNTAYSFEGRMKTDFFGLSGHQLIGAMYSAKNFSSLEQNARFIIENGTIEKKDNTWCFYYNFDQYLYETKKGAGRGIGVFGRFGVSDGNPNPIHYFYSIGVGGKGVITGRPLDQFGLGYYYIGVSNPKFTGPLQTRSFLRDEQGFEAYYNFALTPWMKLTPDIQVIRPAQKQVLDFSILPSAVIKDIGTATVIGLRLQIIL